MNVGVLLAAGESSRMGQPKQLLNWRGDTLVDWTTTQLLTAGCERVVIVTGAVPPSGAFRFFDTQYSNVEFLHNSNFREGQSGSLKLGLNHVLKQESRAEKILIAVCDQPLIEHSSYAKLLASLNHQIRIAATEYDAGGGVPASFARSVVEQMLRELKGDCGAKKWIRSQPAEMVRLLAIDGASNDIDTQDEFNQLRI